MREGLEDLNILVCKQEAKLQSGKVCWKFLKSNHLFLYQIAMPCLDLIYNRCLIMDAILLSYESIITKQYETLFMC
jgi:hypothetical protein